MFDRGDVADGKDGKDDKEDDNDDGDDEMEAASPSSSSLPAATKSGWVVVSVVKGRLVVVLEDGRKMAELEEEEEEEGEVKVDGYTGANTDFWLTGKGRSGSEGMGNGEGK